jgi:hypothetical protein
VHRSMAEKTESNAVTADVVDDVRTGERSLLGINGRPDDCCHPYHDCYRCRIGCVASELGTGAHVDQLCVVVCDYDDFEMIDDEIEAAAVTESMLDVTFLPVLNVAMANEKRPW